MGDEKKPAWYIWKIGRFAFGARKMNFVIEGNNRWKRVIGRLYFRVDETGPGTKD